jgi:uncharacterized protein (DUF2267 family)
MRYAELLDTVEQAAGITREEAERAIASTLRTLAERITGGEARDLALLLPPEVRRFLTETPEEAARFGLDDFYRRVAEREGIDGRTAASHARAVFGALGVAVAPGELRDMAAQLPAEYEPLLQAAGVGRRRAAQEPYDLTLRVAELAGLDREQARRATEAVVETLAVRISAGEVEDLMKEIPPNLHSALERGLRESRDALKMSLDEFLDRIAGREGIAREEALEHARAVFAALRELVTDDELADMAAQLPKDYAGAPARMTAPWTAGGTRRAAARGCRQAPLAPSAGGGRLAHRRVEQRIELLGRLRPHVGEFAWANGAEQRGEHGPDLALGLRRLDARPLRQPAQELVEVERLGAPARRSRAAARAAAPPDPPSRRA